MMEDKCDKIILLNINTNGGVVVKRIGCLFITVIIMLGLTGCGKELSTEENRIIAEYAANLLLKYDRDYQSRYLDEEETTENNSEASTEKVSTEATTTEADTTEPTTEEAEDTKVPDEATSEETPLPPSDDGSVQDIAAIVGLEGISIVYNRCMFLERYPALDQDGAFIYLEADKGYKLVVVKFDIINETAEDKPVDLLNLTLDYRLVMNRSKAAKPMLTILMDDLGTFSATVPAESEQSAVLVFQMSDSMVDKIEQLDIRVTYQNEEHTIPIQ